MRRRRTRSGQGRLGGGTGPSDGRTLDGFSGRPKEKVAWKASRDTVSARCGPGGRHEREMGSGRTPVVWRGRARTDGPVDGASGLSVCPKCPRNTVWGQDEANRSPGFSLEPPSTPRRTSVPRDGDGDRGQGWNGTPGKGRTSHPSSPTVATTRFDLRDLGSLVRLPGPVFCAGLKVLSPWCHTLRTSVRGGRSVGHRKGVGSSPWGLPKCRSPPSSVPSCPSFW